MRLEELLDRKEKIFMGNGSLFRLVVNDELTIHARSFDDDAFFYLYANLGAIPRQEELKRMMEESLFNRGIYFACHHKSNKLILMAALDSQVATLDQYNACFQRFVDIFSHWKESTPTYEKEDILKIMSQKKRVFFI